jgi:hypothetical protein
VYQELADRHSVFATTDIPIRSNADLQFLEPLVKERLFSELASHYRFNASDLEFRDIFLVKYTHMLKGASNCIDLYQRGYTSARCKPTILSIAATNKKMSGHKNPQAIFQI